jgi:acetolactate synthase-1/2/3 large subunit
VPFADQYVADIPAAVGEIERHLGDSHWEGDQVRAHVIRQQRAVDIPTDGLGAHRVVRIVAEQFAAQARVTVDAGAHMFAATMLWPAREPNGVLISNGLSTMGFALPAAIGAALLEPDRPVVALTGDGGLLMCAAELLTAAREKLRIITVVFNDAALSLIEIKQQLKGHPHAGVALGDVNWSAIAEGFGVAPFVAGTELELAQSLDAAARLRGPSLIDVRIDKSNYDAMLRAIRG